MAEKQYRVVLPRKVTVVMDDEGFQGLRFMAYAYGRSVSSLMREAVSEYRDKHEPDAHSRAMNLFSSPDPLTENREYDHLEGE